MASISLLARNGLLLLTWFSVVSANYDLEPRQDLTINASNCTAVKDAFRNITIIRPKGNPDLGHQNLTYCCARAVMTFIDNDCTNTPDIRVTGLTPNSQWPCGATWEEDSEGAPIAEARWSWLESTCSGWQLSAASNTAQWLELLVGFVLPSLIFSLNIPRRRKLKVWDELFPEYLTGYRLLVAVPGAALALAIVVVDNIFWLLTVFAAAGPCLISGIYEGWLDKKVLNFLDDDRTPDDLPLALRARMLFTILTGNLDLYPAWSDTMVLASSLDELDQLSMAGRRQEFLEEYEEVELKVNQHHGNTCERNAENNTEANGHGDRSVKATTETERNAIQVAGESAPSVKSALTRTMSIKDEYRQRKIVGKVSSRLSTMLACQYGFGTTIGGPVLYYMGAFIYALVQIRQNYGERDLSHALGFGMWFMVVPHCAIVSGFLLGGNNPNTLEGIVGAKEAQYSVRSGLVMTTATPNTAAMPLRRKSTQATYHDLKNKPTSSIQLLDRVYEAAYMPASMWNRGQCMQKWLLVLCVNSMLMYKDRDDFEHRIEVTMQRFLEASGMFNVLAWLYLFSAAFLLIFIPCLLGFLNSYFTPQVGLSCRSFTLTMYTSAETLLLILWTFRMTWGDKSWRQGRVIKKYMDCPKKKELLWDAIQKMADSADFDTTSSGGTGETWADMVRRHSRSSDAESGGAQPSKRSTEQHQWPTPIEYLYQFLLYLGFAISIFSSFGGLLMEVLGVFRSNFCNINVPHWLPHQRSDAWAMLSTNSAQAIHLAKATWTVLGTVSLVFLILACYVGWWYQRRLRTCFRGAAKRLVDHAANSNT